jgi:hypothetical protein
LRFFHNVALISSLLTSPASEGGRYKIYRRIGWL